MQPNPNLVSEIIIETANRAILPRFQALADHEVMEKRPGDLVTVADLEAEEMLEARLKDLIPGSTVVGEEAVHRDTTVFGKLSNDTPLWIVDPVDGTANFAAGNPIFGTVVAYLEGGEVRAGWIHMPVQGTTVFAVKGGGALCDGRVIHTSNPVQIEEMVGLLNLGQFGLNRRVKIQKKSDRFALIEKQRCASYNYLSLALGNRHFSLYRRLWPWDHAAGIFIHSEAGGYSALIDGSPYSPTERSHGLFSAPDKSSWYMIYDYLFTD